MHVPSWQPAANVARRVARCSTILCLFAATPLVSSAQAQAPIILLQGGAGAYSNAADQTNSQNPNAWPASCGPNSGDFHFSTVSAAAAYTCAYSGLISSTPGGAVFDAGTFTTTGTASFVAGQALHAHASILGTLAPHVYITNDASANYYDALSVTGPATPASVLFTLAIHGNYSNPAGTSGDGLTFNPATGTYDIVTSGVMSLYAWSIDANGNFANGSSVGGGLVAHGDGTTQTLAVSVPWSAYAYGNSLAFSLNLVAFARAVNNTNVSSAIDVDADYSNTSYIRSVALYDAAGNDITSLDTISYLSTPTTTTPEPASLVLLGTGLAGVFGVARRRRMPV